MKKQIEKYQLLGVGAVGLVDLHAPLVQAVDRDHLALRRRCRRRSCLRHLCLARTRPLLSQATAGTAQDTVVRCLSLCDRYLPSRGNRNYAVGPHYEDALLSMGNYGQVPGRDRTSLQSDLERTVQDSNEPSGPRLQRAKCPSRYHQHSSPSVMSYKLLSLHAHSFHFSFLFAQGKIKKNEVP
jgi:hypothetical protein